MQTGYLYFKIQRGCYMRSFQSEITCSVCGYEGMHQNINYGEFLEWCRFCPKCGFIEQSSVNDEPDGSDFEDGEDLDKILKNSMGVGEYE